MQNLKKFAKNIFTFDAITFMVFAILLMYRTNFPELSLNFKNGSGIFLTISIICFAMSAISLTLQGHISKEYFQKTQIVVNWGLTIIAPHMCYIALFGNFEHSSFIQFLFNQDLDISISIVSMSLMLGVTLPAMTIDNAYKYQKNEA